MTIAEPRDYRGSDTEPREEGGAKRAPRKALEVVEGQLARKKQERVMEGGRRYEPGQHMGEGQAGVTLKEKEEEEERLKADLNQRKLFSETHKQGKPVEEGNVLMEKLSSYRTAQARNQHPPSPASPQRQPPSPASPQRQPPSPVKLPFPHRHEVQRHEAQRHEVQRVKRAWEKGPTSNEEGFPHIRTFEVDLGSFDPQAYLSGQLLEEGGDEMKRFQFNQRQSEMTPYDRQVKDVRNPRYTTHSQTSLGPPPPPSPLFFLPLSLPLPLSHHALPFSPPPSLPLSLPLPPHLPPSPVAPLQVWTIRVDCQPQVLSSASTTRPDLLSSGPYSGIQSTQSA